MTVLNNKKRHQLISKNMFLFGEKLPVDQGVLLQKFLDHTQRHTTLGRTPQDE